MTATDNAAEIFDRNRRRIVRDRAHSRRQGQDFLHKEIADELYERLQLVSRSFDRCLLIGLGSKYLKDRMKALDVTPLVIDSSFLAAHEAGGVQCDEDRLPFADASFDLVISTGALDTVNDLPGALTLIRRILKPDGLFIGGFLGAESLSTLKLTLMQAEGDSVMNHIHPQIDIRTMGDLLQRTGFALPVVDSDTVKLRYRSLADLLNDIRDFGGGNLLNNNIPPMKRSTKEAAMNRFADQADERGRTNEFIEILYVSGWSPHPDQPKAARRGSGQMSLSKVLKDRL
ncbi:MAG: methyltransferase domain-containing protein [Parasphingorhabdus sp.]